jgi:hypothetical protein
MPVDVMAKVKALRGHGKSLKDALAGNLTAPYDVTTLGDTPQSKDSFITEVNDEVQNFPPVVDGKRTMSRHDVGLARDALTPPALTAIRQAPPAPR